VRNVIGFLRSVVVYIILPICRNLVNIRVNAILVLILDSKELCVTTKARISLVISYFSFFIEGEIVAALVSN